MKKIDYKKAFYRGTSICLTINETEKDKLIDILELNDNDYKYNAIKEELEIYNDLTKLVFEDEFLQEPSLEFDNVLKRYHDKNYSQLSVFSWYAEQFQQLPGNLVEEKKLLTNLLKENDILKDGYLKYSPDIPPSLFKEIVRLTNVFDEKTLKIYNYLTELFSLFALANKSKITLENDSKFEFFFYTEEKSRSLKIDWRDWSKLEDMKFYDCYNWVFNKNKGKLKIDTLLEVVRQFFTNVDNIMELKNISHSLDSILNRIIMNETQNYFEQQNKLKNEFIDYQKMEISANEKLMKNFLTLIVSIGVAVYGKAILIKDFKFLDRSNKLGIIFVFGILAVLMFTFSYIISYSERKNYQEKLKNIYVQKLSYSKKDFESYVQSPTLFKNHWAYWITIIASLIVLMLCTYYYW